MCTYERSDAMWTTEPRVAATRLAAVAEDLPESVAALADAAIRVGQPA
jgi:hypothetical protein